VASKPHILVVENDDEIRDTLMLLLEDEGYRVTSAAGGQEAMAQLAGPGGLPVIIILDLTMPGMTGHEVLERLGRDPVLAAIPVVVCSAVLTAVPAGARRHLKKPFALKALLEIVSDLVDSAGYRSDVSNGTG
jgi:CheY-like chemotaxis protein